MEKARMKLLKRIQEGYKPLQRTLDKYDITDVEAKPTPQPRQRDPEKMKEYSKECYTKHRDEYIRKNLLYKVAHGHRPLEKTLIKHGLPLDLNALHPMVIARNS